MTLHLSTACSNLYLPLIERPVWSKTSTILRQCRCKLLQRGISHRRSPYSKLTRPNLWLVCKEKINSLQSFWRRKWHTENRCQIFLKCTTNRQRKWKPKARRFDIYQLQLNKFRKPSSIWLLPRVLLGKPGQHQLTLGPRWMQWGRRVNLILGMVNTRSGNAVALYSLSVAAIVNRGVIWGHAGWRGNF